MPDRPWVDWLPLVPRMPDDQYLAGELPLLRHMPQGIVIHSGDVTDNAAEYETTHRYSYHVAWSRSVGGLVQCVPLTHRAQHAGAAGNDWWGLALSGPDEQDPRSDDEMAEWVRVMGIWRAACGGLPRLWCRHSDLTRRRRDPGPGFTDAWAEAVGLTRGLPTAG